MLGNPWFFFNIAQFQMEFKNEFGLYLLVTLNVGGGEG